MQAGKECGYEEDINIPLIVRGPGVAKGAVSEQVTTHTDLAPTFLSLIQAARRPDFDGSVIPVTSQDIADASENWHEHVNVEYWGFALGEGDYSSMYPRTTLRFLYSPPYSSYLLEQYVQSSTRHRQGLQSVLQCMV